MAAKDRVKELRWVKASELIPHPKNWREHPKAQQDAMKGVLAEIGFADAVIARETPEGLQLIDGHLRQEMSGSQKIPVLVVDVTEEEADKMLVTLDPLAMMANANQDNLLGLLQSVQFESQAVNDMLEAVANGERQPMPNLYEPGDDPGPEIDRAEELREKWGVERGQIWEVGRHRLMCGDCTIMTELSGFINSPDLIIADPPYAVFYAEKNRSLNAVGRGNRIQTPVQGDHQNSEQAAKVLWGPAFQNLFDIARRGTVLYCFAPQGGDQMMMMMMMKANFNPTMHQLIWRKNNHVLGRVDYAYIHEPIIYTWKETGHKFYGPFQTSVIECARQQVNDLHPTMKPVELLRRLMENSSQRDELVLDPFIGSGTTMVAAEQLGRVCFGMDIEPKYVAVTLERMAGMGLEPRLVDAGS